MWPYLEAESLKRNPRFSGVIQVGCNPVWLTSLQEGELRAKNTQRKDHVETREEDTALANQGERPQKTSTWMKPSSQDFQYPKPWDDELPSFMSVVFVTAALTNPYILVPHGRSILHPADFRLGQVTWSDQWNVGGMAMPPSAAQALEGWLVSTNRPSPREEHTSGGCGSFSQGPKTVMCGPDMKLMESSPAQLSPAQCAATCTPRVRNKCHCHKTPRPGDCVLRSIATEAWWTQHSRLRDQNLLCSRPNRPQLASGEKIFIF